MSPLEIQDQDKILINYQNNTKTKSVKSINLKKLKYIFINEMKKLYSISRFNFSKMSIQYFYKYCLKSCAILMHAAVFKCKKLNKFKYKKNENLMQSN